ncbi:manganese efflux pump MntP family protein [Sphingomonas sp. DG1-23]|uniref:manganese efflux pump MntP n=1 Tax=Sphingomonas sp. DG1-23 TaxID=3068316 RepID=UPI00273D4613|nr:manganese efflux pump MntP family protein [Sphingomonas sp. DG1-23]MDP5280190.1 manganese efflux pump MntP family protein [Sphingomonas sp. DG1-23]
MNDGSMLPVFSLLALSLGLAMDAFAVSVAQGAARRGASGALRIGAAFGLAQGLMPLIGWALGIAFEGMIRDVDHWVAFVLLGLLGAKMVREGTAGEEATPAPALIGWALLGAAVATSVDAAAAGITLPMIGAPVLIACGVIGLVTAGLCVAGVRIGAASGARLGKLAEIVGGILLILIGAKILIQHLFFGG